MPTLDLLPRHLALLKELLELHLPSAEVWAYGSRVNGGSHETSDLDLVVRNPSDLKRRHENIADLEEALQMSPMPITVDVHDWAMLPDAFHREIEREHVVIKKVNNK